MEKTGLTRFKVFSEYVICLVLILSVVLLRKQRHAMDPKIYTLMVASILATIAAELAFTIYVSVYGLSNVVGHLIKILSFYLIYRSLIYSGLNRPFETLFKSLRASQTSYRYLYETMSQGVTIINKDGDIIEANPAACQILGLPLENLLGKNMADSCWNALQENGHSLRWEESPILKSLQTGRPMLDHLCGIYNPARGEHRWLLNSSIPRFSNKETQPSQVQNVFSDLTEWRRTEVSLRKRVSELQCLYGLGRLIETPGITLEEILKGCVELIPQGMQYPAIAWAGITFKGQTYTTKHYKDTSWKISCSIQALGMESGLLEAGYWVQPPIHDGNLFPAEEMDLLHAFSERLSRVAARLSMQEALMASEEKQRALLEGLPDLLFQLDNRGRYQFISDNAGEAMGIEPEKAIGRTHRELGFPEYQCSFLEKFVSRVFETGHSHECELTLSSMEDPKTFNARFVPVLGSQGRIVSVLCVCRDISNYKKVERDFKSLFNEMLDGFALHEIVCNENGNPVDYRFLAVNPAFERQTGLKGDDIVGKRVLEILPDTEQRWIDVYGKVVLTGEPISFEEYSKALNRYYTVAAYRPAPGQFACIFADITERKMAESDRERLIQAIEQSGETIVITDENGIILYVNPSFERVTGYSRKEAVGHKPSILKSGEQDEIFYKGMWQTIASGQTWEGRMVNKHKNGSLFTEKATISPVLDKDGKITNYIGVKRDISEEIKLEERLAQSQKMEAIGTLAGGIAHDFNNILTPIFGFTEMLREDLPPQSPMQDHVEEVFQAAVRARDLVKQILTFSRQDDQEMRPLRLQPVIKEAMKLLRSSIPTTIAFDLDISQDCGIVIADPTQIHQIVMNLATNAYHAMELTGGTLRVGLQEIMMDSGELAYPELIGGKYALLTVADTGEGLDDKTLERIFDPYYTTKPRGKGTGLGLSVVHGIVSTANGAIRAYSEKGKGTEFHIYLPIKARTSEKRVKMELAAVVGGSERVLLVDDEISVERMEQKILERLGYRVTARTSSLKALETFRNSPQSFDLVITDMTMPNMTGSSMAMEMRKIRPDIPVILCTGFSSFIDEEKAQAMGIQGYVMKPVVKRELAKVIRSVLDHPA